MSKLERLNAWLEKRMWIPNVISLIAILISLCVITGLI